MIDFNSNIISKTKPLVEYLKKQQENRKFIETVELGATIFLVAFFLLFAIKPTVLVISSLIGEINSKKILTAGMKNKISNVIQAQDSFSQVQQRYLIIDSSLPKLERYSYSANQIIAAARASGIDLTNLNFDVANDSNLSQTVKPSNKNLKSYAVSVSSNSDFASLITYVDRLLNNRRHFEIPTITISAVQKDNNQPAFKILVNAFYWNE